MKLQSEFSREFKKNNFRPFAAPSKCRPVRPAPPSLRLCYSDVVKPRRRNTPDVYNSHDERDLQFASSSGQKLKEQLFDVSVLSCAGLVTEWRKP